MQGTSAKDSVMSSIKNRVLQSLQVLIGLRLTIARHAGNVRLFHFGELSNSPDSCGQYALHLECPWRIEQNDRILTGLYDWYIPATPDAVVDDSWDPADGGSLQEAVLRNLMRDLSGQSRSIINRSEPLAVRDVMADDFGGFSLDLSSGVRLTVFPSGSRGEQWRFFQPEADTEHFVVGTDA